MYKTTRHSKLFTDTSKMQQSCCYFVNYHILVWKVNWSTWHECGTKKKIWVPVSSWTQKQKQKQKQKQEQKQKEKPKTERKTKTKTVKNRNGNGNGNGNGNKTKELNKCLGLPVTSYGPDQEELLIVGGGEGRQWEKLLVYYI